MNGGEVKVGSLFSGIGGFDLGLERAGMQIVWQSEIEPYCCEVLKKHWPGVPNLGDIFKIKNPPAVDLICGGFPCQPFSVAGKRKGKADDRYIWPEMLRVITEVKPRWVFAENVPGIIHMELDQVLSDLEGEGYETGTLIIPACALNAPHRRDRIWILAYNGLSQSMELSGGESTRRYGIGEGGHAMADTNQSGLSQPTCGGLRSVSGQNETFQGSQLGGGITATGARWAVEPSVGRVVNGIPDRVDRLKALGNAIVPQIAEEIGRLILEINSVEGKDNQEKS
ncbi:MAG: DNA (cytosine-5-)-methyltransferase [Proteobacteria bacterium]|nr:DNA (cytosine-5-)-methyltransferase [Pseudomonadota bacterium]